MAPDPRPASPLRVRLSRERRSILVDAIQRHFREEFDEELSTFRAEALLDFFIPSSGRRFRTRASATPPRSSPTS
jgi:hypothetical protein